MLVLARGLGERVLIGEDMWVQVVEIKEGRVRLGFEIPRNIPVVREELLGRKKDAEAVRVER